MASETSKYIYWGLAIGTGIAAMAGLFLKLRKQSKQKISQRKESGQSNHSKEVKNFKERKVNLSKFDSPDTPGSGNCMDKEFITMLQKVQQKTKLPIFDWINSGARSTYWNSKVGGVGNSSHKMPTCKAADIKAPTITIRNTIVQAAKEAGFKRIGIANTFVHLDNDETKAQYVAWGYPSGARPPFNPFG